MRVIFSFSALISWVDGTGKFEYTQCYELSRRKYLSFLFNTKNFSSVPIFFLKPSGSLCVMGSATPLNNIFIDYHVYFHPPLRLSSGLLTKFSNVRFFRTGMCWLFSLSVNFFTITICSQHMFFHLFFKNNIWKKS